MKIFYSKRFSLHRKIISCATILVLLVTLWPAGTLRKAEAVSPEKSDPPKPAAGDKPVELVHLRTENSKTYLKPDKKTYVLEEYLEPVHFKSNGKWLDIDNRIESDSKNALDSELPYINKANRFRTGFAKYSTAGKLVRIQLDKASLDFRLTDARKVQATVQGHKVTYPGVYPDTDLVYDVKNSQVKEEWWLNKYNGRSVFTMVLNAKNAKPLPQKDGSIRFVDAKGKELFFIPRPFMMDANGVKSDNIRFRLRTDGNITLLDLQLDETWLKDSERAYPVVVDPSIVFQGSTDTFDTFVGDNPATANYGGYSFLLTGTKAEHGKTRTFIKFHLSPLLSGAKISSAKLSLYQYNTDSTPETVYVYPVTSDWDPYTVNWNTQPAVGSAVSNQSVAGPGWYDFYFTQLVKDWYSGTTRNYGISLRQAVETDNRKSYWSSDSADPNKPKLTITYTIEPIGTESFWTSAISNVNTFSGNYFLQETDLGIEGRGVQAAVDRSYNSRSTSSGMFGYGWTSSLEKKLIDSGEGPILYTDEDGTPHTFTPVYDGNGNPTGSYDHPGGVYLDLVKNADGTYTLSDGQTKYQFNAAGKLASVVDSNGNTTTIGYTGSNPTTITDPSGRQVTLTYNANNRVTKVTDPANRTVEYAYDASGNLTGVTHKDASGTVMSAVSYGYDANHNLTSVTDPNGNQITIGYDASDRTQSVSQPITVNGTVQTATTTFTYDTANNITTVTDPKGIKTVYTHNAYGNVIQITQDPTGLNYKNTMTYDDQNQLTSHKDANTNAVNGSETFNYTYDENGNLTGITSPLNETITTTYDDNHNPVEETDPNGNTTTNEFDDKNNQTSTTDAAIKSSAKKYDAYGNVIEETSSISIGQNLITNGSFEKDINADNWPDNWTKVGNASWFSWDPAGLTADGITLGKKSVKITNPTSSAAVASDQVPYDPNKTYVMSGYVKTNNARGIGRLYAFGFNSTGGVTKTITYFGISGTQGPTRLHLVLEPGAFPAGTQTIQLRGYVGNNSQGEYSGEFWFDGLMIEEQHFGAYNVLENGDFEHDQNSDGIPDDWTAGNRETGDGFIITGAYSGKCYKINGNPSLWKSLSQEVNLSGAAGAVLTVSGHSRVENPNPSGGIYGYIIETYLGSTKQETFTFHFDKTKTTDWQHKAAEIETTKSFDKIKVYYEYSQQSGAAWFDAAKVFPGSIRTLHTYDAGGNYEIKTTDAEGRSVEKTYDAVGNVTSEKKGTDTTTYAYDARNRMTQVTDAKQGITRYEYDANGNRTKVTNANNKVTTYAYNELNQVKTSTDPLNRTTQKSYDINGNLTKVAKPNGATVEYGYNAVNRRTSVSHNGTQRYAFEYDPNGHVTKETDLADNRVTTYSYDADGKLTSVDEGNGNTVTYTYDNNANVTQRTHTAGATTLTDQFTYNTLNQLIHIKENSADRAWFAYDEGDHVASRKNGDGTVTFYRYNGAGNLVQQVNYDKNGNILDSFTYTYDNKGNITSVTSGAGTTSYQYDELDQLIKETRPDGTVYEYTYDAVGNRLTKKVTQGGTTTTTTYAYDDANQMTTVDGTNQTYDANGNLTSDGSRTYVYDAEDRLIAVKNAGGATIASFTYRADGLRKTMTTSTGTITFHYDENKNVVYETDASNRIVASYTYNAHNQPVSMTRDGQTYYYQWNGHGDVVALTDSAGNIVATYDYDAYGNILRETGTVENPYRYAGYRYDQVTGLYYLQHRYYNPRHGVFLTKDPLEGSCSDPISQNAYAYADNNPVMMVDPDGNRGRSWAWYYQNHWLINYKRNCGPARWARYKGDYDHSDYVDYACYLHDQCYLARGFYTCSCDRQLVARLTLVIFYPWKYRTTWKGYWFAVRARWYFRKIGRIYCKPRSWRDWIWKIYAV